MNAPRGIPLRPDRGAIAADALNSLVRAAIACGQHKLAGDGASADQVLRQRGWDDRTTTFLTRAATAPALTSTPGWAAELAQVSTSFLQTLTPLSAAAQLLGQVPQLSFDGTASIRLPAITPGSASFISEGAPIKVARMSTSAVILTPSKLASIVTLSREMFESANVETVVRQALIDSTATALDAALFDANAGTPGLRPPGLLYGATAITPSAGGGPTKIEVAVNDIAALVSAVSAHAGNGAIVFVASPAQAVRLLMAAEAPAGAVYMSAALAPGTVVCVATNAVVAVVEPITIDASKTASFHAEDTAPLPIVGTAGAAAAPVYSSFQMDSVALRIRLPVSWAVRVAGAVSYVAGTNW